MKKKKCTAVRVIKDGMLICSYIYGIDDHGLALSHFKENNVLYSNKDITIYAETIKIDTDIDCGEIYIPVMVEERLLKAGINLTEEKAKVIYAKDGTIILKPMNNK